MKQDGKNIVTMTISSVRSKDRAEISYLSVGKGPSVIIIPGALSMATDYSAFAHALAKHFTVHIIERRGRGRSAPQGDDYSMTKEIEDVLSLQVKTGATYLVGHSYGGLISLEVARFDRSFAKVAVYEPGVSINHSIPKDWMREYEQKLIAGKYFDAFVAFSLGTGPDRARSTPPWLMKRLLPIFLHTHERQQMLSLLTENLREHREVARLDSSYKNYREITAPVLLMYGGKSGIGWVNKSMAELTKVLPSSETKEFPKLNHFGIVKKAPLEVASVVADFFLKMKS